jgi:hypothetical protein
MLKQNLVFLETAYLINIKCEMLNTDLTTLYNFMWYMSYIQFVFNDTQNKFPIHLCVDLYTHLTKCLYIIICISGYFL